MNETLNTKLATIQTKFKSKKSRFNSFGKYNFRSAEDILEALKPYNKEHGVYFTIKENLTLGDFPILHSTATIVDAESGDQIEGTAVVGIDLNQKGMQMPQRFGSASSYGKKYSLGNLFLIDDTQDSDATNNHGKQKHTNSNTTPIITPLTMEKVPLAIDYLKKGNTLEELKKSYSLTNEVETSLLNQIKWVH